MNLCSEVGIGAIRKLRYLDTQYSIVFKMMYANVSPVTENLSKHTIPLHITC